VLGVTRKDPDAELQSPDFVDLHPSMREWVAGVAGTIDHCASLSPTVGEGWRRLALDLKRAAGSEAVPD